MTISAVLPNRTATTESGLLAAALAGDAPAWNAIVRTHDKYLRRVALSYRVGPDAADDAVQTAWLRLIEHGAEIRDAGRLRAWLATTVRRECLATIRRRERETLLPDADAWDTLTPETDEPVESQLLWVEAVSLLREAVAELPPRNRELITLLSDPDESDYRAVSDRMSIPVGSIGPTRLRSLTLLHSTLAEQGIRECPRMCA